MRTVNVALGERSYPIRIVTGEGAFLGLGRHCAKLSLGVRCAILTDSNVGPLFAPQVEKSLRQCGFDPVLITVPAGETAKSLRTVAECYDQLAAHRLERNSFVVAVGGGVVGDLAGFVAATYLRGIAFVQVPTSLLAQVDSSVGGKVGVNLRSGKNLVGAFYQPKLVFCALETLRSLPDREFRSGLAEIIKYGVIYDATLFRRLERNLAKLLRRDESELSHVIARSCKIKADVVSQDETESGLRAILNFGHTIGHAIENSSGYGKYLHGEAIAIGQTSAAFISNRLAGLSENDARRIQDLFAAAGLPTRINLSATQQQRLFAAIKLDKKVSAGAVKFVLAERIGKATWGCRVPESLICESLEHTQPRHCQSPA